MENILYANFVPKINPNFDISYRDNEYIVTLRESNFHLKISSKLFNLLEFVDNNKNLAQIVNEFNKCFHSKIDVGLAYELFYNKLGRYNIIENSRSDFEFNAQPSYLKLNIIILNAATVKILSKPFLFLFSNRVLSILVSICLIITSGTFIVNYGEILLNIKSISADYFALYIVLMIVSSLFHELGHASATCNFGGKHSGIGVGFYLFTPVMYADVSSAWKFDVGKRIIVNLAGIYFELLLGTILILVSFVMGIKALLIIPSIILFKTLFNLNPFFRTDGYWVLSDAIRTPNLRSTSNDLLKQFVKNKMRLKLNTKELFLIIYAFISNSIIFIFLFYLFIKSPNSLITFPVDIYSFVNQLIKEGVSFSLTDISKLLVPVIFYILVIRLLLNYLKKRKKYENYEH